LALALAVAGVAAPPAGARWEPGGQAPAQRPEPAPAQQVPAPAFRTGVDLVAVDVSIVDERGNPVRGLKPEDFQLSVDGQPRTIVSAEFVAQDADTGPPRSEQFSTNEGAAGGRLILIAVDQGSIRRGGGAAFIKTATRLLDNLGPGDRVGLAVIPGGRVLDFTGHFALVRAQLERLAGAAPGFVSATASGQVGVAEALAYDRGDTSLWKEIVARECPLTLDSDPSNPANAAKVCADNIATDLTNLAQQVRQHTQNAMMALQRLVIDLSRLPRPKTVLLLSEGIYLDRSLSEVSWVAGQAAASRVSLYGIVLDDTFADIDTSQRRASPTRMDDRQLRLDGLHVLTGLARGAAYEVAAGADSAFDRVSRELTGYYLVAFEPLPTERDGKKHDISVKVRRSGVEVRARREFTVNPASTAARTDEDLLAESLRDPLLATERRMRVATYSLPDPQSANVRLLISAGLGLGSDDLAVRSVAFKVTDSKGAVVASRVDKAPERSDQDHRYLGTVVVPPGTYTLKIAGVDEEGRRGSVEHLLEASLSTAGALAMSDLVLGLPPLGDSGLRPSIEPSVSDPTASAYLELKSSDVARLGTAAVRIEVAAEPNAPALVATDATVSETAVAERRIVLGEIALDDLQTGDYVARAVVQIEGKPVARVLRSFRYAPGGGVRRTTAVWRTGSRAFDRARVLQPQVVGHFLAQMPPPAEASVAAAVGAAREAAGGGRYDQVAALLAPVKEADPSATLLKGLALYARGELEPAAAEFRRAIAASQSAPSAATFYLGVCYAAGGRDSEAVGAWQTALAAGDDAPSTVYAVLGDAYLRLRDPAGAVAIAREALDANPADDEIRLQLAEALTLVGNQLGALDALDPYFSRHPADHERLFSAMRVLQQSLAAGEWPEPREKAVQRFERYYRAYLAARGPEQALASHWRTALRGQ
jgi:VWFA-related protein